MRTYVYNVVSACFFAKAQLYKLLHLQTALEEAVADGDAAKGLLQMERDSTALLAKARQAAVEVKPLQSSLHACPAHQDWHFMHNSTHSRTKQDKPCLLHFSISHNLLLAHGLSGFVAMKVAGVFLSSTAVTANLLVPYLLL